MLQLLKSFFDYSGTIVLARLETFIGFIIAVLAGLDWSPLLGLNFSTGFDQRQLIGIGSVMVVKGVVTEIVRRRPGSRDPIVPPEIPIPKDEQSSV